jgi:hypothetical protein
MSPIRIGKNGLILLSSTLIQVILAIFLGHSFDERVFMAAGYLTGSGKNPYQPLLFGEVFPDPQFLGFIPSIGYPPPWPLLLGIIFRLSFSVFPSLILYNFAIKVPVIIGNIGLAYLIKNLILKLYGDEKWARTAWLFILFNPFVLLTTAAWGMFDTLVALFVVYSLYLLDRGRISESAFLLAFGVVLKPTALPIAGLPLLFLGNRDRKNLRYLLVFTLTAAIFYFGPFLLLGWTIPLNPSEWDVQFRMLGAMSPFNILDLFQVHLPSTLEFVGFLWAPAVLLGYYAVHRDKPRSMEGLVEKALGLTLVFFLTRTWLSETNINLVLPLMLLVTRPGQMNFRNFNFAWLIPLAFMVVNTSIFQLFFLIYPNVNETLLWLDGSILGIRLVARFLVVVLWQIFAWGIVIKTLRPKRG